MKEAGPKRPHDTVSFYLHEISSTGTSTETECTLRFAGVGGWGRKGEQLLHGSRVSFENEENVLELARGDGCTTL